MWPVNPALPSSGVPSVTLSGMNEPGRTHTQAFLIYTHANEGKARHYYVQNKSKNIARNFMQVV